MAIMIGNNLISESACVVRKIDIINKKLKFIRCKTRWWSEPYGYSYSLQDANTDLRILNWNMWELEGIDANVRIKRSLGWVGAERQFSADGFRWTFYNSAKSGIHIGTSISEIAFNGFFKLSQFLKRKRRIQKIDLSNFMIEDLAKIVIN